jgi:hypothetical protein
LESLTLNSTTIGDKGVRHLSQTPSLRRLRLNSTRITDQGVSYLTNLPEITSLELRTTRITDEGLKHLGHLPKLHTLYLNDTAITGSGMVHLAPLAHLRLLGLDNTLFGDRGLGELAEHPNLARIEVLYLANTKITDAGCPAFENLNDLLVLTVAGTDVTDKGVRHINNMPRLYCLVLSSKVTARGRNWLAENARFASSLQTQLQKAARAEETKKANAMDLETFQASLDGADAIVFRLGLASHGPAVEEAGRKLLKMKADAIKPILDMAEKTVEQGHLLNKAGSFRFRFRHNAAPILRAVCIESMPSLANHYANSPGKREVISSALARGDDTIVPHLESWLEHESPLVRLEALRRLEYRSKIYRLGPGAASPTTRRDGSLHLSEWGRERVISLLADSTVNVQHAACPVVLAMAEDHAVKAEALVAAALREQNSVTVYRMLKVLCELAQQQPIDGKGLPALINGLEAVLRKADHKNTPHIAMNMLGDLGGKAEPATGLLRAIQEGPDERLAATAEKVLEKIRRCPITLMRAADVDVDVQNLVFTLTTCDSGAVERATGELVRRGPSMFQPLLTAARGHVNDYYPQKAAAVVVQWDREDVLPMLRPVYEQKNTLVRIFVIQCIIRMEWSELPDVVQASLEGLDAKVRGRMRNSLSTLAKNTSGQASQELARLIAAELKNPGLDFPIASRLTGSLTSCHPDSTEVPSLLIDILQQETRYSSRYACGALGDLIYEKRIAPADQRRKVAQAILAVLRTTKDDDLKAECLRALSQFGAEVRSLLPILRQIEQEGSERLAEAARRAMAAINGLEYRPARESPESLEDLFPGE